MPVATAVAAVGAAAIGASASAKAAKKAANAQVTAANEATALERDTANYAISQSAPLSRSQAEARARQMLMSGIPADQVEQYLRDAYSASYQTLPDSSGGGGRVGMGYTDGEGQWVDGDGAPGSTPSYDTSWVRSWSPQEWLRSTPGYEFNLKEGQRTLERSKAAGGDFFSGDTAMALTKFGQDYADGEWDDLWNQYGDLWGGGSGSKDGADVAINFGNNAASNTMAAGRARASGYQQAGNAWGNFWQGAAGIPMYGLGQGWWGGSKK